MQSGQEQEEEEEGDRYGLCCRRRIYFVFLAAKMYQSRHSCQIEATRESILYLDLDLETLEPLLEIRQSELIIPLVLLNIKIPTEKQASQGEEHRLDKDWRESEELNHLGNNRVRLDTDRRNLL